MEFPAHSAWTGAVQHPGPHILGKYRTARSSPETRGNSRKTGPGLLHRHHRVWFGLHTFPATSAETDSGGTRHPPTGRQPIPTLTHFLISWAPAALWAGVLFFLSAQSSLPGAPSIPFGDKVAHFLLYAVLGVALAWAGRRSHRVWTGAALILLGIVFAASDEWHQAFVPRRQPSIGDLWADVFGIIGGFLVAAALLKSYWCSPREDV